MYNCDDVIVPTVEYALWLPCHRAGLFGVAVREHVWHPVDLGSSPGRVTLLSLRYKPIHKSASPNHGVLHTGSTFLGVPHTMFTGAPPMTSQQSIPLLTPFVAKGERDHPTRTRTRVYRVPNMDSDRHTKEPGSMAWQPEHTFICRDDHIVTRTQQTIT